MAASSQSLHQQLLAQSIEQLNQYQWRWFTHYRQQVSSILDSVNNDNQSNAGMKLAQLVTRLLKILINHPQSRLAQIRIAIMQLLDKTDGEGNDILMQAVRYSPDAVELILQIINHPLFKRREWMLQRENNNGETALSLACESPSIAAKIQIARVGLSEQDNIAAVQCIFEELLAGDFSKVSLAIDLVKANPAVLAPLWKIFMLRCDELIAKEENTMAMVIRGIGYAEGLTEKVNLSIARKLYLMAAKQDNPIAMNNLAKLSGDRRWYQRSIKHGYGLAMMNYGFIEYERLTRNYNAAKVVARSNARYFINAYNLYHQAIKHGCNEGWLGLALLYHRVLEVEIYKHSQLKNYIQRQGVVDINYQTLEQLLDVAIMHGFSMAATIRLKLLLEQNSEENKDEAMKLIRRLELFEDSSAMMEAAKICYKHEKRNAIMAAATQSYSQADQNEENRYARTILLLDKAIAGNNPKAMKFRADMYGKGEGGKANLPQAIKLYQYAMRQGESKAADYLHWLYVQGWMFNLENKLPQIPLSRLLSKDFINTVVNKELLDLSFKFIRDKDIPMLLTFLNESPSIQVVDLSFNFISDEGAIALASLTTVDTLYLECNWINTKGALALLGSQIETVTIAQNRGETDYHSRREKLSMIERNNLAREQGAQVAVPKLSQILSVFFEHNPKLLQAQSETARETRVASSSSASGA